MCLCVSGLSHSSFSDRENTHQIKLKLKPKRNRNNKFEQPSHALVLASQLIFILWLKSQRLKMEEKEITSSSASFHYGCTFWIDGVRRGAAAVAVAIIAIYATYFASFLITKFICYGYEENHKLCAIKHHQTANWRSFSFYVSSRLDTRNQQFLFHPKRFCAHKNSERNESWSMNWFKPDGLMKFTISVSRGTLFVLSFVQSIISVELRFILNAFLFYAIMIS